ncbi:glucose-6-phosphate dehydrogenase [Acetobacter cibinongensis]|uniref:Glucose-6-phosphate 1-dehydrogenase n=1 Tax=Acetobacter cibinongensis TaxID=146475 RepID=A0A1Z5YWZ7_9PROT|nr:glucose-6-phosphate dehydrogenase [Acetobacter cibinongensis]OUJ03719.1 glucose-6-phosphate dehydrogenase [Acetobacter cibinongensis]
MTLRSPSAALHAATAAPAATHPAPACTLVILGAGGDLTHRLLVPALYDLACSKFLPEDFQIIGVSLEEQTTQGWVSSLQSRLENSMRERHAASSSATLNHSAWQWLSSRMHYLSLNFTDPAALSPLSALVTGRNVVFYLATPPRFFEPATTTLYQAGLLLEKTDQFRRVVIEKPFGTNLQSAQALNAHLLSILHEKQIYRVDHFLGKETVQNLLALRFSNILFEPLWCKDYIDHIQITAAETLSVEGRGVFYDATGALRDMVPNHLFQILALVAMERPVSLNSEEIRNAKQAVFEAIRPITPDNIVRGQYQAGTCKGRAVPSYRDSQGVSPDSMTETYAALRVDIETARWQGVPFYLRTGKALSRAVTEIVVQFKAPTNPLFHTGQGEPEVANRFVYNIRPDKGANLYFNVKNPGPETIVSEVTSEFRYEKSFGNTPNIGYETLLYDCLQGNATLFQRADNIEAAWRVVNGILQDTEKSKLDFYTAGSSGPLSAETLLARDGRKWASLTKDED